MDQVHDGVQVLSDSLLTLPVDNYVWRLYGALWVAGLVIPRTKKSLASGMTAS